MRSSVWGGANRDARSVHAAVVGDSERHRRDIDVTVRDGGAVSAADRADGGDICCGGEDGGVHDPAAVRVRHEFPHRQIPAGAEQDDGDGLDFRRGDRDAHALQLALHAAPGLGPRRRRRGAQLLVVVHRGGAAHLHSQRPLRPCLVRFFLESLSESLEFCQIVTCLSSDALVSHFLFFFCL